MPKNTFQRVVFTVIGVILMATTMATYNKYLVMKEFSPELFRQVAIAFCQKAPFAFILQFFFVQKWVGRSRSTRSRTRLSTPACASATPS